MTVTTPVRGPWETLHPYRSAKINNAHQLYNGLENWFGLEQACGLTVPSKVNASWPLSLSSTGWTWRGGPLGGALTSDAASGTTGTWEATGSVALGTTNMALAGWAYLSSTGLHGTFWKIGTSINGFALGVGASDMDTGGNNILGLYESTRWINTGVTYPLGWHHYALIIDGSGNPIIYLDGAQIYSDSSGAGLSAGGERALGYSPAASTRGLAGTLGPFGFWRSRALSASDVQLLYLRPDVLYQATRFWVLSPPIVSVQTAVPVSDVSTGSWTPSTGSDLYAMLDETVADDTDYILSPRAPSNNEAKVRLGSLTDPNVSTGHIVRYRFYKDPDGGARGDLTVTLYAADGTTSIASNVHTDVGPGVVQGSFTLTGPQADAIPSADYATGLVIGLKANAP